MVRYDLRLCGLPLALESDFPLGVTGGTELFRTPPAVPRLTVTCRTAEDLPWPGPETGEHRTAWTGAHISRGLAKSETGPLAALLTYDLADPTRAEVRAARSERSWVLDELRLWSTLCLPQLLLPFRVLVLHASYIGIGGRAVLFTAPSGTGKSTQAALWQRHRGAAIHNGDKAGISLRPSAMAHGLPFSGTSGICENVSLPLAALVVLSQAPENTVRRLGPAAAAAALSENLFADPAVPAEWQAARLLLLDLVSAVPVYALACTPDVRAVETLEQVLELPSPCEKKEIAHD